MSNDTREALAAGTTAIASRNLRAYLTKALFASNVDREAALNCVSALEEAALTEQPAAQPVAHFLNNAADGEPPHYAQVAAEFIGTEGVIPLYAHPVAAPQPLTDEQRLYLSQAAGLLDEYGAECSRGGADSTAKGCEASAYALRQLLRAAPAAPAQERAQAEPTCLHSAATILTVAADAVIRAYRAKYRNTSRGGFNARAPLYAEIVDLNAALVGMGGLDNRGELLRHAAPAAPAQEPQQLSDEHDHETFDAIAAARYRVVPTNSGFWGYAVVVGDSTAHVYKGHKRDCELVARRMAGAFLDGAYLASQRTPATAPAVPDDPEQHPDFYAWTWDVWVSGGR